MNAQTKKKGFTIIEVVLVLAIAGLIFLMVFVALPALQRSQRDTQRREDVSRFVSQINSFQTNNDGSIPANDGQLTSFKTGYLKWNNNASQSEFNDPQTGEPYNISFVSGGGSSSLSVGSMVYYYRAACDNEAAVANNNSRSAAVRVQLEGSGVFCQDNQ